jgi:(1->4)-alpha-D-glucan 1-alpha-D-glucosylmutase
MRPPVATYRLQLNNQFGFDDVARLADYLVELGVSHVYTSPYLQAVPGSTHGYDVADHGRVSTELGGAEAHERMCTALLAAGLSQVLDVVPNHMAIGTRENRWWWDVLENGRSSRFASYFDVDWGACGPTSDDRVLLPVLAEQYGRVVEAGAVRLHHDDDGFVIAYGDRSFPMAPASLATVLTRAAARAGSDELMFLASSLARLPQALDRSTARDRNREKRTVMRLLARAMQEEPITDAVQAELAVTSGDADLLDQLLSEQNYRLAYWQTGRHELEYRRFFDIDDLVGLRVEDEEVFEQSHELVLSLVSRGVASGLRIDHPDGLRDPKAYLSALRNRAPAAWVVVEKILQTGESLPEGWPVSGTTGYEFLSRLGGLFLEPTGFDRLADVYWEAIGAEAVDWPQVVRAAKGQVLDDALRADLDRLVELLLAVCERHRRHRDHSRFALRNVVRALIVHFPVYRTYVARSDDGPSQRDRAYIQAAVQGVRDENPRMDAELLDWLQDLLLLRDRGPLEVEFALRFQQLTGPVMAKGVEDTAFYRFNRLLSANEVGGDPGNPTTAVEEFHQAMADNATRQPHTLLATSTHDSKRSEDVRARLAVLTEIPERWRTAISGWLERARQYERGAIPDPNTAYHLFQILVGAWPIDEDRVVRYMEKAIREAKTYTSWTRVDEAYEAAVRSYASGVLADPVLAREIDEFVGQIAHAGRINSLAQALVRLTAPGVPDIYQGTEIWDLSLVDPDNRRPVDFELRGRLLAAAKRASPEQLMAHIEQGLPKLWTVHKTLLTRRAFADVFADGRYRPLPVEGERARCAVAFVRADAVATVVPRFPVAVATTGWEDTCVELPAGRWTNVLTGEPWTAGAVAISALLARFPVALLTADHHHDGEEKP